MSKFAGIFIFVAFLVAINQGRVVGSRRDVSELLLRLNEDGQVIYGNGIEGKDAQIEESDNKIEENGNYEFFYKQSDLQERQEKGEVIIDADTGNYTLDNVVGSYRYVRPDGYIQIVEYKADKDGFVPTITVVKYEAELNDPPSFIDFVPSGFPIGSTTEAGSGSSTDAPAGLRKKV